MNQKSIFQRAALLASMALCLPMHSLYAQEEDNAATGDQPIEEVVVTGTRITVPGTVSSSPIQSISADEINFQQEPELERILRLLPATIPADGSNVNNGTDGAATIDLRGLGSERNLVLLNGRRLVPYNYDGEVDTSTIPSAVIERIDIITGGASAVYGSDAMAGAINIILKKDFTGVEFSSSHSQTGDSDGDTDTWALTVGSDFANDRGNVVLSLNHMERKGVLLGQRPLGLLGIDTATGGNYAEYLAGEGPAAPPAGCGGPFVAATGGSTTAIPTRFAIVGGGAAAAGQFREDGTIGSECSVFNFNPFNYYQTPMERYSGIAMGHLDLTDKVTVYSQISYSNTTVVQQIAPSGTFGEPFDLPLANPLIGDQARQFMIDAGNTALANGLLTTTGPAANWQDINNNGVVDSADYLNVQLRRRTLELGPRSENFDSDIYQFVLGTSGNLIGNWNFDASFQYGESNRTTVRDGYTNLTNIQNALDTMDGVTCNNGDPTCVPINLFGGFGTITEEMASYARAIALQQQKYEQTIFTGVVNGPFEAIKLPSANNPLAVSFGYETREEKGTLTPDECLKLAPSSCQGGAGGNLLPISGGYKVDELFMEGILPLIDDAAFSRSLALELGVRSSDYDLTGKDTTSKLGLNWRPIDSLMIRVMQQDANRAPNVGELASPIVTGLDNAKLDPCSVGNAGNITPELRALCISTGMSDAQVGAVQNLIAGQVNTFDGSDPDNLPKPEQADTFTAGFVWTPHTESIEDFTLSLDYYDIEVNDYIGEFSAQEILDACYAAGITSECEKIHRIGGDLTISGSGIDRFTSNLDFKRAEGIEVGFSFGVNLEELGNLHFSGNINKFLTQESQSSSLTPVIDCKGFYGTTCEPISELRWIQRTTWNYNRFTLSAQWRHINSVDVETVEANDVFPAFRQIGSYDYLDLYASYAFERFQLSLGIDNVTDKDPPVLGNEVGDTSSNSGNTFPSNYDSLGRIFTLQASVRF